MVAPRKARSVNEKVRKVEKDSDWKGSVGRSVCWLLLLWAFFSPKSTG
jgi:hypothetical protein